MGPRLWDTHPARFPPGGGGSQGQENLRDNVGGASRTRDEDGGCLRLQPLQEQAARAELGWVQNRLKAAAQPGLSLGRAPPPADGCWVQKRRRCCRASPPAALSLPSRCPEPPCCPGRTHEAVIDPGPVVNERNIGVNELGPDNTVTTRLAGRGRASVSPAIFWTN